MTLRRVVVLTALVGAMVITIVYEQARIRRAGYEISRLSREEVTLTEQVRIRDVYVTRLRQPERIARQVVDLRIGLRRPPDAPEVAFGRFASASSEFAP